MIDYNYPIKYAVMEVKVPGGWLNGYEEITVGYIVSKCYLIESRIRYHRDGTNEIIHDVLFPYIDFDSYKRCRRLNQRIYPKLYASGKISDYQMVSEIFTSYDEANELKKVLNENLKKERFIELWIQNKDKNEDNKKEFSKNLKLCDEFETLIEDNLSDLKITGYNKTLKLISH